MFRSGTSSVLKTARRALVLTALSSTILGVYALVPMAQAADHGGWTTTKVASGNNGGYCAVSRKVDDTMITVGRSVAGQSSLALEFSKGKLDPKKVYRLSLKPGNADRLEVETKPVSATTMVLNLDQVVDLVKSFDASPTLQLRYDAQSIALSLANWDAASKDIGSCLTALKGKPDDKVADKSPAPTKSKSTKETKVDDAPVARSNDIPAASSDEVQALRDQNERLNDVLRATRQELENAMQNAKGAPVAELQEKIKLLEDQNAELSSKAKEPSVSKESVEKLRAERDQAIADLGTLKAQASDMAVNASKQDTEKFKSLNDQIAELQKTKTELAAQLAAATAAQQSKAAATKSSADLQAKLDQLTKDNAALKAQIDQKTADAAKTGGLSDEISKLKVDNQVLQAKLDAAMNTAGKVDPATQKKIDGLQDQIDQLTNDNADLRAKLVAAADKPKSPGMPELQQRLEAMATENVKLRASLAAATSAPANDVKVAVAAEQPLRQQLRSLQSENDALRARSDELFKLMDQKQRSGESDLLKASSKNWDLEQATRRYQEAEREVKRLSLTMRDERAKCTADKKQIEYMLFDPKLAKDGQIALLNSLEDEVASLRAGKGDVAPASAVTAPAPAASVPVAPMSRDVAVVPSAPQPVPVAQSAIAKDAPPVMQGGVPASKQVTTETLAAPANVAQVKSIAGVDGLTNLLRQAGISISQAITPAKHNPFGTGVAYVWESNELAGMAAQQKDVKAGNFDNAVSKQLKELKSACKGDFAAQPAQQASTATLSYAAYDAACIAGANSTSAAILFYQKDGSFNVISHETAPDDMAKAMDARDRIVTTLGGRPS